MWSQCQQGLRWEKCWNDSKSNSLLGEANCSFFGMLHAGQGQAPSWRTPDLCGGLSYPLWLHNPLCKTSINIFVDFPRHIFFLSSFFFPFPFPFPACSLTQFLGLVFFLLFIWFWGFFKKITTVMFFLYIFFFLLRFLCLWLCLIWSHSTASEAVRI